MDVCPDPRGRSTALAVDPGLSAGNSDRDDAPEYGGRPCTAGGIHFLAIWTPSRRAVAGDLCRSFYCVSPHLLARDHADLGPLAAALPDAIPGSVSRFRTPDANRLRL